MLDGPINGVTFTPRVEQCLAPTLVPGHVVVMDNLGSHKDKAVRRAKRIGSLLDRFPPAACAHYLHNTGYADT